MTIRSRRTRSRAAWRMLLGIGVVVLVAVAVIVLRPVNGDSSSDDSRPAANGAPRPSGVPVSAEPWVVLRVVDGDTARARPAAGGREVAVRLMGVDTPETSAAVQPAECGADQASAYARVLLPVGSVVRLEPDVEEFDRYKRTLRYLWLADGRLYPQVLVEDGIGRALVVPPNDRYADRLRSAEAQARQTGRGGWASCGWNAGG